MYNIRDDEKWKEKHLVTKYRLNLYEKLSGYEQVYLMWRLFNLQILEG